MVMNAFDTNFDSENEFYAVNTVAFHYAKHPIRSRWASWCGSIWSTSPSSTRSTHSTCTPACSMYYRTGTRLKPQDYTDIVTMGQGERHILEFRLEYPGPYMFHAHQSEFSELGWLGVFEASEAAASTSFEQATVAGLCDPTALIGGRRSMSELTTPAGTTSKRGWGANALLWALIRFYCSAHF